MMETMVNMSPPKSWSYHFWATLKLSFPLMIGQIALISIWTADIVMMGWISTDSLAAGTQANRMYQPLYFIAIGLTLAVSPLTSQALGARRQRVARQVLRMGIWMATIYGLLTIIPLWYGQNILLWLRQDPAVAEQASTYLRFVAIGMAPTFIYFVLRNYVSAYEKPIPPVIINIIGVGINIFLNYVFIHGMFGLPAMALAGIGLGTSLTFMVMVVLLAGYMIINRKIGRTRPFSRLTRFKPDVMKRLLIVGFPIGLTLLAETGMFIVGGIYMGVFGIAAVAASGIGNQLAAITYMVPLAISLATTIRIGHAAGANHVNDAIRAGLVSVYLTVVITLIMSVVILIEKDTVTKLFLNQDDVLFDEVMIYASGMLLIVAIFQLFDGLQSVFVSALRGISDTRIPALISILSYWGVGVVSGYILATPMGLGPIGVWIGMAIGLGVATIILGGRCWRTRNKLIRQNHFDLI
jgi:MATE family multidrug resistance protein